jgi:hypothetical protein
MTDPTLTEEFPVFLRVVEEPVKKRKKGEWDSGPAPNDRLALVFDMETFSDARQEPRFGIAQLYSGTRLVRTMLIAGELALREREAAKRWAEEHRAKVLTIPEFVSTEFLPLADAQRANVVGFNLPFDLSRIAADFEPKRKTRRATAWKLSLIPRSNPKWAHVPRIRIEHVSSALSFIGFTGTKDKFRRYPGAFVDCRTFVRALTGESYSLEKAGEALGCVRKKTGQDYHGVVNARYLDYCLNDVELTAEVYFRCRERYAEFGLSVHPSRLYSSATLAKALWKERGIVPPKLSARIAGQLMAAFHGGQSECRVRGRVVEDVAVLDFTQQYASLFCLLRAETYLAAKRIATRDATDEVRGWVESLTLEDLFRKETWANPLMWSLCGVESSGAILPLRTTHGRSEGSAPTIGWNHVTTEAGLTLPYMVPDLLAARLLGKEVPGIVKATIFEPVGSQDTRSVRVLGVEVGIDQGLVRTLAEARIREKRELRPGWKPRSDGLKTINNAGSYGIFVEVNRKSKKTRIRVHGLEPDPFELDATEVEEPGSSYFPLIGAELTAASHLLLTMVDTQTERLGGRVVYCDTDSGFVTPSQIAPEIAAAFAELNPYGEATAFLKDETEDKAPKAEYPPGSPDKAPRFFALSAKRYALFVLDKEGRPHVFRTGKSMGASDHGLGSFRVGKKRKEWIAQLWERIIEKGEGAAEQYAGIPATSEFTLSSPNLLPRVTAVGPIRPFTFLTARLLEPSKDPKALRSELVAFTDPEDSAGQAHLRDMPRQKSWGSVVEDFVNHHDWKYTFDAEGRAVRRHVLVRRKNLVGLGKEANRIEDARVLGLRAVGGRAKTYADLTGRVLGMGRAEARRLGIPWATVTRWKKRARAGLPLTDGHGGRALTRLRRAFASG